MDPYVGCMTNQQVEPEPATAASTAMGDQLIVVA